MASISTLTDTFTGGTLDTGKWTAWGSTTKVQNNDLEITSTLAANYGGIQSVVTTYDLTGSQASIKVTNAGNQSLSSLEVYPIELDKDASKHSATYSKPSKNSTVYTKPGKSAAAYTTPQKTVNGVIIATSGAYRGFGAFNYAGDETLVPGSLPVWTPANK